MIFLSVGNLSTAKVEGLVYQTANADTYNLIKIEFGGYLGHLTWLHSSVLLGVMNCDRDQACLYLGF